MPNLKIHIDPFNGENSFFKNGIRIGKKSHSPFRNLTSVPILSWIYKLPSLAGNEMNDNYDLVVSAPEFESALIRLVMKGQPMCSSVIEEPFEVSQSVTDRIEAISVLQSKYKPSSNIQSHSNVIAEEDDGNITHIRLDKVLFEISNAKEESIEFNNNGINWHTPDKSEVSRIIHNRYVDIPSLIDAHNQLKEEREKMSDEDIIVYDSLLLTVPRIIPTVPKEIEVGTSSEIGIKVVPNGVACPKLSFSVDNPAFSISGRTISANDSGFGTISISREDDPENVLNFAVKAFIHNKVSSIRVSANSNVMESGR